MLDILDERSSRLWIWPQGDGDSAYVQALGYGDRLLASGLKSFHSILGRPDIEYVGTRLHGAIRALERGVPSVVVVIDNRAAEIGKDVGLWTVQRGSDLTAALDNLNEWHIRLPPIHTWRDQITNALFRDHLQDRSGGSGVSG